MESEIRCVRVGNEAVLVGRLESGCVVAFGSSCPHETTDLDQATFVGGMVRCPRHNYLYNPVSGANVIPTDVSRRENLWKLRPGYLPTYRVEEHDGWVWVSKEPNPAPAGWDPTTEERPRGQSSATMAASPAAEDPPAPSGPVQHPLEMLRMHLGAEFEVRLPAAPVPACTWRIEIPTAIVALIEQSFNNSASPPHYRVLMRAHGVGEGMLRCSYGRPWEAEPIEIRTYSVNVERHSGETLPSLGYE